MCGIRKWQRDYGFEKTGKDVKNLIAPCGIRDHYKFTRKHLEKTGAVPIDEDASDAIKDPLYYKKLTEYNEKFLSLTDDIWQKEFIENGKDNSPDEKPKGNKNELSEDHSINKNGRLVRKENEISVDK